eukprot:2860926-Amphidinium_carterae.3
MRFLGMNLQRIHQDDATVEVLAESFVISQNDYILDILSRFAPSMNYRSRSSPGDGAKLSFVYSCPIAAICLSVPTLLGTLMWVAGDVQISHGL